MMKRSRRAVCDLGHPVAARRASVLLYATGPAMKARSPLLGYNHNIRYAGRLYHVQTEDSGLQNPHVFTHLFFGGTILASKRSNYDPESTDQAVQKVMQAQHKAMLKELRAGAFDDKIEKHFGEPVVRETADAAPSAPLDVSDTRPTVPDVPGGSGVPELGEVEPSGKFAAVQPTAS